MKKLIYLILILFLFSSYTFAYVDPWYKFKSDWTPLMKGIFHNRDRKIDRLINKADSSYLNYVSWTGLSALNVAIRLRDSATVEKLLLTKKIVIDPHRDMMNLACVFNCFEIVKLLFQYGFPIFSSEGYSTSLCSACKHDDIRTVDFLIKNGVDVNQQYNENSYTPLIIATMHANIEIVELLLQNGADKEIIVKHSGQKALDFVDRKGLPKETSDDDFTKLLKLLTD